MSVRVVDSEDCRPTINASEVRVGISPSVERYEAWLLFLFLAIFAFGLANIFNYLRLYIYKDNDSLDAAFDAGGKVSIGLTATTIVSQWTWAATLLQSSSIASKYGISGPFWYAAGGTLQILLFSIISVQLKIRAPGAKTFLQLIQARFDKVTHIVYCVFALITNVIVTAMLMLGGTAVMTNLIRDFTIETGTLMTCGVIACYTFIGGLGATFYVSYFNTAIIFVIMLVFIMKIYYDPNAMTPESPLGNSDITYEFLRCALAPEGNYNGSYLTFLSLGGLMFGIINIVGLFATVFVDQSYWQSSVAAKPKEGVWGFLSGGLVWFAVPFGFATTTGLAYISLSARQGVPLLTPSQVDEGLVPPVVAQRLLGHSGEIMLVTAIVMAITSTGSAEVMAVVSILVYDIYAIYWKPYRSTTDMNTCILCGRQRGRLASIRDKCSCESMTFCQNCHRDSEERDQCKRALKPGFQCKMHGPFRTYKEYLNDIKNWCILVTIVAIIPLTLTLSYMNISLGWLFLFMGVLIGSAVVPVTMALFWTGLTGFGMTFGTLFGSFGGLVIWLAWASTYPGGLSPATFIQNTGENIPMLVGNVFSMLVGAIATWISSLIHRRVRECPPADESVWELTRDIDNPLSPWTELYAVELNLAGAHQLDKRPSLHEVAYTFRYAKYIAYVGSISLVSLMILLWPGVMAAIVILNKKQFAVLTLVSAVWAFLAAIFIIVMPLINEFRSIYEVVTGTGGAVAPMPVGVDSAAKDQDSVAMETGVPEQLPDPESKLQDGLAQETAN